MLPSIARLFLEELMKFPAVALGGPNANASFKTFIAFD